MHNYKEMINLPADFPFYFYIAEGVSDKEPALHFHDCLEINYILEGSGVNIIENKRYPLVPGDFYVINNLEHHIAASHGFLKMVVIVFDPIFIWKNNDFDYDYLKVFFNRNVKFSNRICKEDSVYLELDEALKLIEKEWRNKHDGYRLIIKSVLMMILGNLYRNCKQNNALGEDITGFQKSYDRLREVMDFININLYKKPRLAELAAIAHMNKTYFSSYFKKVIHMNPSDYMELLRINKAMHMLRMTNDSITEIAMSCGYNDASHFNKVFKKHSAQTPNEFRHIKTEFHPIKTE